MGRVKGAVLSIFQCSICEGQGWIIMDGQDEPCECNPMEVSRETIAEWDIEVWKSEWNILED